MVTYFSNFSAGSIEPFWPHAVLLTITVVASFSVAVGIIFESPKYRESIQRAAMWAIIAGVTVEALCTIMLFTFDERISNAQQAKIIALEARLAPRWITDEQKDKIVSNLKQFKDVSIDIWLLHAPSQDAAPLADRLLAVLNDAKWSATGVFDLTGGRSPIGVFILTRSNPTPNDKAAAEALLEELKAADISTQIRPGVGDDPLEYFGKFNGPALPNPPANLWLVVGSKP